MIRVKLVWIISYYDFIFGTDSPSIDSALVQVLLQDANDNPPIFEQEAYSTCIPEVGAIQLPFILHNILQFSEFSES